MFLDRWGKKMMMNKGPFTTIVSLSVLLILCPATQAQVPERTGVSGQLLDQVTRAPLEGFVSFAIDTRANETLLGSVRVDEDGFFTLPADITYGPVFVTGYADGYGRAVAFFFLEPTNRQRIELLLPLAGQVEGIVTDPFGNPVGDATVTVEYEQKLRARLQQVPEVTQRARSEGFHVVTNESSRHGGSPYTGLGSERKPEGQFVITEIDPNRPLRLVAKSEIWGEVISEVMTLVPGEVLVGLRLSYGR